MSGAPILSVERLVAGYEPGLPIVNGASIHAARGEIVALLGPNGAGKSTLIKAVAGLAALTSGKVRFDGKDLTRHAGPHAHSRGIGFRAADRKRVRRDDRRRQP